MNISTKTTKGLPASRKGFTLIELLVVIGIIAILAAIVIIAVNPARQFAQARNAQRESDTQTILNAIGQNMADNKGTFTCNTMSTSSIPIAPTPGGHIGTSAAVDLSCLAPTYLASAVPMDPDGGTAGDTLYTIQQASSSRYVICAPKHAEGALTGTVAYCVER